MVELKSLVIVGHKNRLQIFINIVVEYAEAFVRFKGRHETRICLKEDTESVSTVGYATTQPVKQERKVLTKSSSRKTVKAAPSLSPDIEFTKRSSPCQTPQKQSSPRRRNDAITPSRKTSPSLKSKFLDKSELKTKYVKNDTKSKLKELELRLQASEKSESVLKPADRTEIKPKIGLRSEPKVK